MSDEVPLFRIVKSKRSSGGGMAVACNIAEASRRHPDVLGDDATSRFAFVPLNWVHPRLIGRTPYVLMPQNAWPWGGEVSGLRARARRISLRALSELSMNRALGVIRMGDLIPAHGAILGDILPNVLDEQFESALHTATGAPSLVGDGPGFVSIGSLTTYRGIGHLITGYAHYRAMGGTVPLVIAGPGRAPRPRDPRLMDGITLIERSVPRAAVLATFLRATAAVFPSSVETTASITMLEAAATCRTLLASDIPGHRAAPGRTRFYQCDDPLDLAQQLADIERTSLQLPPMKADDPESSEQRSAARRSWCDDLANRLRSAAQQSQLAT